MNACVSAGGPSLTEEQLESMCPSAAAIAAIVKPGMKFFDVSPVGLTRLTRSSLNISTRWTCTQRECECDLLLRP